MASQKNYAQNQKPNIIFILGDDIGYNTLTVNGGRSYETPNLDSMARNGMNFTQCQASPMCSPSRVSLLTGKYNFRNYTQWSVMDTAQKTFGNIFKNAGYATGWFGKWQLDGGETSIRKFGFDSYCVFDPFEYCVANKYKNPRIYTNGAFVPDSQNSGKYGEDIFTDSAMNFIERNKSVPFLLYYPMGLAHVPFQPTPDDAAYASWNSTTAGDTTYYPSMIKYMDKKIGQILNKVKALGIENNTLIIYCGDNGTPANISQYIDGDSLITGGKSTTTEFGTHVPLIMYWPNTIAAGSINNDLIDFTDFLPTFAGVANLQIPSGYAPVDGVSFSSRLTGGAGTPRSWIFDHYNPYPGNTKLVRWAQTSVYKLYDTSAYNKQLLFFNISKDINEKTPIADASLTPAEVAIKQQLLSVIKGYVLQGVTIFSKPAFSSLTDSAVTLKDTILSNGGSTITASGFVWSPNPNPTIASSKTANNVKIGT
ncbi:MAG TPA: sulfatase-like hydrolase/transferase, partial [Parafilimonas sp.]